VGALEQFRLMAGYNGWMNEKLYAICGTLSDEERKRDRKAFFRSIHGILNHLLLTDRGWLGRFTGAPWTFRSLDQELYADFEELRRERAHTDAAIEQYAAALTAERLCEDFSYTTYAGRKFTHPLGPALTHLFNHQTHHRGQAHAMLTAAGQQTSDTDLFLVLPGMIA